MPSFILTIINSNASAFPKDVSLKEVSIFGTLRDYVVTLLRDRGGSNAIEYALMMALVAVFIIAGVLATSGAIGTLFNSMSTCLNAPLNCSAATFDWSNSNNDDDDDDDDDDNDKD